MMKKLLAGSAACLFMLGITSIANGAVIETGDVIWDGVVRWRVGNTSVGSVTIDDGTVKDAQYVDIGYGSEAVGTMNVTGAGSSLENSNIMEVGSEAGSQGTINVTDGGLVESNERTFIGVEGTGTVNLSGAGSKMIAGYRPSTFNEFTIVGHIGNSQGTVNINPGTSFEAADNLHVGYFDNSQGTVNVLGGSLSVAGELLVGHQGNSKGTLIVDNGVVDIVENVFLGYTASSEGIANISNGSTVTLGDDLVVGFNVTNGTTTKSTMNITGAGTTVSVFDRVAIGFGQASGQATEALLSVGRGASMDASRIVAAWSGWDTATLQFIIGDDGTGTTASGLINAGEFGIGTGTSQLDLVMDPTISLMVGDVFTLVDYDTWDGDLFSNVADGGLVSAGDYLFLIDYDNDLGGGDMALTATVMSAFDGFVTDAGLDPASTGQPHLDPDFDSLQTGIEWVVGGNPNSTTSDTDKAPTGATVIADRGGDQTPSAYLLFTYRRTDEANLDGATTIAVEYGSNLTGWSTATVGVDGVDIYVTDEGFDTGVDRVEVFIPTSLAGSGKLFARLNVAISAP